MADEQLLATAVHVDAKSELTASAQPSPGTIPSILDSTVASYDLQSLYENVPLQYGHAQNIRVLQIARGDVDGSICCELSTILVRGDIPNIAVSYEWGGDTDQRTILIGGEPFKVRQNLWEFLSQMQRGSQGKFFWIDAICIQQANIHERNHQVAMMGDIYSNASKVIVWLGTEQNPYRKRGLLDTIRSAILDPDSNKRDNQLELRECLRQLAMNTYWTRAWILQEFVLGAQIELRYGSACLQEDIFRLFWAEKKEDIFHLFWADKNRIRIGKAKGLADDENTRIHAVRRIVNYRLERQEDSLLSPESSSKICPGIRLSQKYDLHSLEYLSEEFVHTRCSDPRDRVYSLLSLVAADTDQHPIVPDYAKTAPEILTALVRRHCDSFPVFRIYYKGISDFMESSDMTRSAIELELEENAFCPLEAILVLTCRGLERYALLWAFMLEIGDSERACRDAIRTYFDTLQQEVLETHSSLVSAVLCEESLIMQSQRSDIPSILELVEDLHSRGLLAFDTARGSVDWLRSCSEGLWPSGSLKHTVYTGNIGRATPINATPELSWFDDGMNDPGLYKYIRSVLD